MIIFGVIAIVSFAVLLIALVVSDSKIKPIEKEKGPMPKRHGGIGPVHGGKS